MQRITKIYLISLTILVLFLTMLYIFTALSINGQSYHSFPQRDIKEQTNPYTTTTITQTTTTTTNSNNQGQNVSTIDISGFDNFILDVLNILVGLMIILIPASIILFFTLKLRNNTTTNDTFDDIKKPAKMERKSERKIEAKTLKSLINTIIIKLESSYDTSIDEKRIIIIQTFEIFDDGLKGLLRYPRPHYLTPLEYATEHIEEFKNILDEKLFLSIITIFYQSAYREFPPDNEEYRKLVEAFKNLEITV